MVQHWTPSTEDIRSAYIVRRTTAVGYEAADAEFERWATEFHATSRLAELWWIMDELLDEVKPRRVLTPEEKSGWKQCCVAIRRALRVHGASVFPPGRHPQDYVEQILEGVEATDPIVAELRRMWDQSE